MFCTLHCQESNYSIADLHRCSHERIHQNPEKIAGIPSTLYLSRLVDHLPLGSNSRASVGYNGSVSRVVSSYARVAFEHFARGPPSYSILSPLIWQGDQLPTRKNLNSLSPSRQVSVLSFCVGQPHKRLILANKTY